MFWLKDGDNDLDAQLESPNDPSFNEFDQQMLLVKLNYNCYPGNGHVCDAFINCAVDENLARSIFLAISSAKNKSIKPLQLCKLKISVTYLPSLSTGSEVVDNTLLCSLSI